MKQNLIILIVISLGLAFVGCAPLLSDNQVQVEEDYPVEVVTRLATPDDYYLKSFHSQAFENNSYSFVAENIGNAEYGGLEDVLDCKLVKVTYGPIETGEEGIEICTYEFFFKKVKNQEVSAYFNLYTPLELVKADLGVMANMESKAPDGGPYFKIGVTLDEASYSFNIINRELLEGYEKEIFDKYIGTVYGYFNIDGKVYLKEIRVETE